MTKSVSRELIDYLHGKDEDIDDKASIPNQEEIQYRERLRFTIGELKVSKEQDMYWSIDDILRKLLRYIISKYLDGSPPFKNATVLYLWTCHRTAFDLEARESK